MTKTATRNMANGKEPEKPKLLPGTSRLEWIVAGISAAGLGAVVFYLTFIALTGGNGPAQIDVAVSGVMQRDSGYVVEFAAMNRGGKSAAGVEIVGRLTEGRQVVEESSVTLDYIPQHSQRRGGLIFLNDPQQYDLQLSASGYFEP